MYARHLTPVLKELLSRYCVEAASVPRRDSAAACGCQTARAAWWERQVGPGCDRARLRLCEHACALLLFTDQSSGQCADCVCRLPRRKPGTVACLRPPRLRLRHAMALGSPATADWRRAVDCGCHGRTLPGAPPCGGVAWPPTWGGVCRPPEGGDPAQKKT